MTNFYSSDASVTPEFSSDVSPLLFKPLLDLKYVESTILTTGNLVTELIPVTQWIKDNRSLVINKYTRVVDKINEFKSRQRESFNDTRQYLYQNIFTSRQENKEYLVPTSIISLGAFLTGRIICNNNYKAIHNYLPPLKSGQRTLFSTVIKSAPSKLITPWILVCSTFAIGTPETWNNLINDLSRRWLPVELQDNISKYWNDIFISLINSQKKQLNELVNVTLTKTIKNVRENCINIFRIEHNP